jgi:hypothetical protein
LLAGRTCPGRHVLFVWLRLGVRVLAGSLRVALSAFAGELGVLPAGIGLLLCLAVAGVDGVVRALAAREFDQT